MIQYPWYEVCTSTKKENPGCASRNFWWSACRKGSQRWTQRVMELPNKKDPDYLSIHRQEIYWYHSNRATKKHLRRNLQTSQKEIIIPLRLTSKIRFWILRHVTLPHELCLFFVPLCLSAYNKSLSSRTAYFKLSSRTAIFLLSSRTAFRPERSYF